MNAFKNTILHLKMQAIGTIVIPISSNIEPKRVLYTEGVFIEYDTSLFRPIELSSLHSLLSSLKYPKLLFDK